MISGMKDVNNNIIETMDTIKFKNEVGIVINLNDEFLFVNDYLTLPLYNLEYVEIVSKRNKLDEILELNSV